MLAIFAGRGVDNAFKTTVCKRLLEKTEITEISSGAIKSGGVFKSALTTVFDKCPVHLNANGSILILNKSDSLLSHSGERFCIFDSANAQDAQTAKKSGGEVISCGMSLRDSVTFSSVEENRCVISLQRSITRLDGSKADPFEMPVYYDMREDRFGILSSTLLLILMGYF